MGIIKIVRYNSQGEGVGYLDKKIAFVPFSAIGDMVMPTAIEEHKSFLRILEYEIKKLARDRITTPCSHFSLCGGCQLQHLPYCKQLEIKKEIISNAFCKIAKLSLSMLPLEDVVPATKELHYRHTAQFHCNATQVGMVSQKSNQIIEVDNCLLLDKNLESATTIIKKEIENYNKKGLPIPPLFSISLTNENKISISPSRNSYEDNLFNQVNRSTNALMQEFIFNTIKSSGKNNQSLLELFSGNGNFSLPLNKLFSNVVGIDYSKASIVKANNKAKKMGLSHYRYIKMDCTKFLQKHKAYYDWVLLDPARAGMKDIKLISKNVNPQNIIYISCNPTTLARDVKQLLECGYKLISIKPFDMFPQTYHVETVVLLSH